MSATRGRVCVRAISHALALAAVLLAWAANGATAAAPPEGFYGVNSGGTLVNDAVARPAALASMRSGGLSYVRVDASWGGMEPAPPIAGVHTYVWTKYDLFVADLARNGLRWYPMLGYSALWASSVPGDYFAPPAGDANFAAFVAAFAGRYGTGGSFWASHPELPPLPVTVYGIWNEPSNSTFWHGPDATPARYMQLYLAARAAIRSVDPAGRVATAGMLDSGVVNGNAYVRAMLDSNPAARGQIDALGWQPYVGELDQIIASIRRARTTLNQYGMGTVPIEISEVGWHTGFDNAQRAGWLRGLAATLPHAGLNVTRLIPYVWTGDPTWQLANPDGSLALLGAAYFAGIRDAFAPQPTAVTQTATATTPTAAKAKRKTTRKCKTTKKSKAVKKTTSTCVTKAGKKTARAKRAKRAKAAKARAAKARSAKLSQA